MHACGILIGMDVRIIAKEAYAKEGLSPLLEIPEPPEVLWLRGSLPAPGMKKLAIVGSRALSPYGQAACEMLVKGLAGYPISIVSGLALGADSCAHRAAVAAGLHTIAVPGSGLDNRVLSPQTNLGLAKEILAVGGALLSEHEPDVAARPQYFPSRNRIVVGMSDAVLVIEAAERSGTLISARLAGEYGRDLMCVPHRITDPNAAGSHQFIRLGAELVTSAEDILQTLGIPARDAA